MIPKIFAVFVDLDNTLIDYAFAERRAFESLCVEYRFCQETNLSLDELYTSFRRINQRLWNKQKEGIITSSTVVSQRFVDFILATTDWGRAQAIQQGEDLAGYYHDMYNQSWQEMDGATNFLKTLCEHYPIVGVITNGHAEYQMEKIATLHWESLLDVVIISSEIGVSKPHRDIFSAALNQGSHAYGEQIQPENAMFIGDHYQVDIVGAKQSLWHSVWFNPYRQPVPQTIEYYTDWFVHSLQEATTLIESLADNQPLLDNFESFDKSSMGYPHRV